jgi:DNA-3-methyladenine glycosylase II
VLVQVTNHGTIEDPDVRFRVLQGGDSPSTRAVLAESLRTILGLEVDPRPLQRLLETERRLGSIARALRGMRPPRFSTLFEAFANVIPFQQVSLESGIAIVGRLVERFGKSLVQDGERRHAFPAAHAIAEARLDRIRACGLSARKAEALRRIATAIESGDLTESKLSTLSSDEAIRLLTELPGIGTWSANLVLLRGLGRLDVFPPGDVGASRGLGALMHLRDGSSLDRVIQRFGDHRGYLYFCGLGGMLLARGLIHPAVQSVSGSRTTVAASTSSAELSR